MCNSAKHNSRKNRESLSKRLGKLARRIKARDNFRCVYCGRNAEESGAHLHLDHLLPKANGGLDTADNLALTCRSCNSARQALSLEDWAVKAANERGLIFTAAAIRAHAASPLPEV